MKDERGQMRQREARRTSPLAAVLLATVLLATGPLAACGGSAGPGVANAGPTSARPSPGGSSRASMLAYSRCMRSHGITKFPDPNSHGDLALNAGPGTGIDPNSAQYKAADRSCKSLMPPSTANPAQNRPALLRYSKCMRAHGVRDFPDPKPGGGIQASARPGSDMDPNSPVFKAANQACKHLVAGLGGSPGLNSGGS